MLSQALQRAALVTGLVAWTACVALGMKVVLDYQSRPGQAATAPATWPLDSTLPRPTGSAAAVVFAHPRCNSAQATLDELARSMARARLPLSAVVVLVVPGAAGARWAETDVASTARRIPHVRVVVDRGGVEARRFGVHTSGQLLYYAADGRLAFAGGITPGRGRTGDNAGGDMVSALAGGPAPFDARGVTDVTPVFGCPLETPPAAGARP